MSKQYTIKSKFLNSLNETLQKMLLDENTKIIKNPILEADGNFTSVIDSDNKAFDPSKINSNIIVDDEDKSKDTFERKNELTDKAINKIKQSLSISDELQSILNEIDKINKDTDYNDWKLNDKQNTAVLKSKNANIFLQNNHICLSHDGKIELFKSVNELHNWLRKNNYPLPKNIKLHESILQEADKKNNKNDSDEDSEEEYDKEIKDKEEELKKYLGPWFDILYDKRNEVDKAKEKYELSKILYPDSKTASYTDKNKISNALKDISNSKPDMLKDTSEIAKELTIDNPFAVLSALEDEIQQNNENLAKTTTERNNYVNEISNELLNKLNKLGKDIADKNYRTSDLLNDLPTIISTQNSLLNYQKNENLKQIAIEKNEKIKDKLIKENEKIDKNLDLHKKLLDYFNNKIYPKLDAILDYDTNISKYQNYKSALNNFNNISIIGIIKNLMKYKDNIINKNLYIDNEEDFNKILDTFYKNPIPLLQELEKEKNLNYKNLNNTLPYKKDIKNQINKIKEILINYANKIILFDHNDYDEYIKKLSEIYTNLIREIQSLNDRIESIKRINKSLPSKQKRSTEDLENDKNQKEEKQKEFSKIFSSSSDLNNKINNLIYNLKNNDRIDFNEINKLYKNYMDFITEANINAEEIIKVSELYPKDFNRKIINDLKSLIKYNETNKNKCIEATNPLLSEINNNTNQTSNFDEYYKFLEKAIEQLKGYDHYNKNNPQPGKATGYEFKPGKLNRKDSIARERLIPYAELYAEKDPTNKTIYNKLQTDESIEEGTEMNNLWYLIYQNKNRPEKLYLNDNWRDGNILTNDIEAASAFINREDSINELQELYNTKKCDYPFKPVEIDSLSECGVTCGSLGPAVQYTANKNLKEDDLLDEMSKASAKDAYGNPRGSMKDVRKDIGLDVDTFVNAGEEGRDDVVKRDYNSRVTNMATKNWNVPIDYTKKIKRTYPDLFLHKVQPGKIADYDSDDFNTNEKFKITDIDGFKNSLNQYVKEILEDPEFKDLEPLTPEELIYTTPSGILKYDSRYTNVLPSKAAGWQNAWKKWFTKNNEIYHWVGEGNRSNRINNAIKNNDQETLQREIDKSERRRTKEGIILPDGSSLKQATTTCLINKDKLKPFYEQGISIINAYNNGEIDDSGLTYRLGKLLDSDDLFKYNKKLNKSDYNFRPFILQALKEYCTKPTKDNEGNNILKVTEGEVYNTLKFLERELNISDIFPSYIEDENNFSESIVSLSNEFLRLLTEADTPADFATNLDNKNDLSMNMSNSLDNDTSFDMKSSDQMNDLDNDSIDLPNDNNMNEPNKGFGDININGGMGDMGDYGPEEDDPMMNMPMEPEDEYKIIDILVDEDDKSNIKLKVKNLTTNEIEEKDLSEIDI